MMCPIFTDLLMIVTDKRYAYSFYMLRLKNIGAVD
jgi:hypothetical protein